MGGHGRGVRGHMMSAEKVARKDDVVRSLRIPLLLLTALRRCGGVYAQTTPEGGIGGPRRNPALPRQHIPPPPTLQSTVGWMAMHGVQICAILCTYRACMVDSADGQENTAYSEADTSWGAAAHMTPPPRCACPLNAL